MDIDEFLDREIGDLDNSSNTDKASSDSLDNPSKEMLSSGALSADAGANLTKANLEGAEHSYDQLWRVLMQQNLKWNKDLYDQLSGLSKQFSSTLSQAFGEMKNKAGRVYELISRARSFLNEGKKDMALKMYSQLQEISNSIPNAFFQEKRAVQEQVNALYRDVVSATDAELIKKVLTILQEISQGIERINSSMMSGDIESASAAYIKCIELYNQVPEGFLKDKNPAGMRLLDIYRSLSISTEISGLQKQLGQQQVQFKQQPVKTFIKTDAAKPPYPRQPQARQFEIKSSNEIRNAIKANPPKQPDTLLKRKREHAKKNIKKGFYNEAWKDIEEALQADPDDVESKALRAKIKTLQ